MRMLIRIVLAWVTLQTLWALDDIHQDYRARAQTDEVSETYLVTGTGDSIMAMAYGFDNPAVVGTILRTDYRWLQFEYGRQAYTVGLAHWASTQAVALLAIERSRPGGYVVIQDNGLGVSEWGWRQLMKQIVAAMPSNRTLIGVLPSYRATVNASVAAVSRKRAVIMAEEFQKYPRRRFVYMAGIMASFPNDFLDGQHPQTEAAQAAIRGAVHFI